MAGEKPFVSNGTTSDPREMTMWHIYTGNLLKGKDNENRAAMEAGYSEEHSDNITLQGWFKGRKDKLRRKDMLSKAERNLEKALDTSYENDEGKIMPDVMRIVVDVSKTITGTLGKDEGYSTRSELTGKDGAEIMGVVILPQKNGTKDTLETSTETGDSTI
jgi:hypothetical protein